jgi:hypothetical protein
MLQLFDNQRLEGLSVTAAPSTLMTLKNDTFPRRADLFSFLASLRLLWLNKICQGCRALILTVPFHKIFLFNTS